MSKKLQALHSYLFRNNRLLVVTLGFLLLFSLATYAYAAARLVPYNPGETNDPTDCFPGEGNCFVQILPDQTGHAGEYLTTDGTTPSWVALVGGGGGTVTSVGLAMPSIFTVSNSPVTAMGTLTATLNTQTANTVFAGPTNGAAAAPTFRALVTADLPAGVMMNALTSAHIFVGDGSNVATDVAVSGDLTLANTGAFTIGSNVVTNAKFRQSAALSVVGNGTNATANVADISGTTDQVLRVNSAGNALAFGTIATGGITNSAVTYAKIQNVSAASLLGNPTGGSAAVSEITLGSGLQFSGSTIVATNNGTVTSFSSGNLSPLFTTSVSNSTTTPALSFALNTQSANTIFAGPTNGVAATPTFRALVTADLPAGVMTTALTDAHIFVGNISNVATDVAVSGDLTLANTGAFTIATNAVTNAKFRQSSGLSVVGTTGTSTANVADITGTTDQVLRVNSAGTALAFGTVATGGIANSAVTYAKIQNVTAARLLGNPTGGAAAPSEISLGAGLQFSGSTIVATNTGTVTSFSSGNLSPLFTTSVATSTTTPALSFALSTQSANTVFAGPTNGVAAAPTFRALVTADLPAGVMTTALTDAHIFVGNVSNVATDVAVSGDLTLANTGAFTIATNAVTNAKFRQSAALSVVGNGTNATANVADISGTTDQVLRVNGAGTALAFGTVATGGIANDAVTYAKIQNVTSQRILGRYALTAGDTQEITVGSGLNLDSTTGILTSSGGAAEDLETTLAAGSTLLNSYTIDTNGNTLTLAGTINVKDTAGKDVALFNARQLYDNSGTPLLAAEWTSSNRKLYDTGGTAAVDWNNKVLRNSSGQAVDWANYQLINGSSITLDWNNRQLYDAPGNFSIDWGSRRLYDSTGASLATWGTGAFVVTKPGIAATPTDGIVMVNGTAATLATQQQYSPSIHWTGSAWKSAVTAASQVVDFRSYVIPVPGVSGVTGILAFESSVNGGGYANRMVLDTAGNVGIGTSAPRTRLELANDGAILATGTLAAGWVEPNIGAGTRLVWYPRKAAFRAGGTSVVATAWDNANIGDYSAAFGLDNQAQGGFSFAVGQETRAVGDASFVGGLSSITGGTASFAFGNAAQASAQYSVAIGDAPVASGVSAFALGTNITAPSFAETVIGQYNTAYTPLATTSWDARDRLFTIGNGISLGAPSDALVILKNGDTTFQTGDGFTIETPGAKRYLEIDPSNTHIFAFGDVDTASQGTRLVIDDTNLTETFQIFADGAFSAQDQSLNMLIYASSSTQTYSIGNVNALSGTHLALNDSVGDGEITGRFWLPDLKPGGGVHYVCYDTGSMNSYGNPGELMYGPSCGPSSERFKHDISTLDGSLAKVNALRPVQFVRNSDNVADIGFIGEEVLSIESRVVRMEEDGVTVSGLNYAQFAPLLAGAIQELDLKLEPLTTLDLANENSLGSLIRRFMESATNGIRTMFADKVQTKELCIEDVCVTKTQLQQLLNNQQVGGGGTSTPSVVIPPPTEENPPVDEGDTIVVEESSPEPTPETIPEPSPEPEQVPTDSPQTPPESTPEA